MERRGRQRQRPRAGDRAALVERRAAGPRQRGVLAHRRVARRRELARRRAQGVGVRHAQQAQQQRRVAVVERGADRHRERGADRGVVVRVVHQVGERDRRHGPAPALAAGACTSCRAAATRRSRATSAVRSAAGSGVRPAQRVRAQRAQRRRHRAEAGEPERVGVVGVDGRVEDQPRDAVRVRPRVGQRELGAVGDPEQRQLLHAGRLPDRLHVLDAVGGRVEGAPRAERARALLPRARRPQPRIALERAAAEQPAAPRAALVEAEHVEVADQPRDGQQHVDHLEHARAAGPAREVHHRPAPAASRGSPARPAAAPSRAPRLRGRAAPGSARSGRRAPPGSRASAAAPRPGPRPAARGAPPRSSPGPPSWASDRSGSAGRTRGERLVARAAGLEVRAEEHDGAAGEGDRVGRGGRPTAASGRRLRSRATVTCGRNGRASGSKVPAAASAPATSVLERGEPAGRVVDRDGEHACPPRREQQRARPAPAAARRRRAARPPARPAPRPRASPGTRA